MRRKQEQDLADALDYVAEHIDVLWGVADKTVLSSRTAKSLLLFSYRNRIPFVGLSAAWTKAGALYALDRDYEDIGKQCGEMALKILQGATPQDLPPVSPRRVTYSLNLKVAQHMKVDIDGQLIQGATHVIQ